MSELLSLLLGITTIVVFFTGIVGLLVGSLQVIAGGDWSLMIGSFGLVTAGALLAKQLAQVFRKREAK